MSLYYYIMQCANIFKYIFTNLFVIVYELNDTLWSLFYAYRFELGNIAGQLYPRFSFIGLSQMCPFCCRLCPDSAYDWQTVCTSQSTLWILFRYRFACFWIQNTEQCFLFPNRIWNKENTRHKDFSRLCWCGRLWQKTAHFLEMFNGIRK